MIRPYSASVRHDDLATRLRLSGSVFAEDEATLLLTHAPDQQVLEQWVRRRTAGEPLEVIVGWVAFAGQRVSVAPGVFVPRRRTELMARLALLATGAPGPSVELCCGAAPVAAVLDRAGREVWACDIDPDAVAVARHNLSAPDRVRCGDLFDALPPELAGTLVLVAANAPYVPTDEIDLMPREARDHEPTVALDGGPDGVTLHRRIAAAAPHWLAPGGTLLIETSRSQQDLTLAAMRSAGLVAEVVHDEDLDATVAVGVRSG